MAVERIEARRFRVDNNLAHLPSAKIPRCGLRITVAPVHSSNHLQDVAHLRARVVE